MKIFLLFSTTFVLVTCSPFPSPDSRSLVPMDKQTESSSGNTVKIFELGDHGKILRQYTDINEKSEVVLKEVDKILLECTSYKYPVQWRYQGNGVPVLKKNATFSRTSRPKDESLTEYVATIVISPATESNTGKYICSNTEQFDDQTYFYIYVPGPTLYNALNGQDILIPENDTKILLPCTTSSPDVEVTLEKSVDGVLEPVKPSLWTYDPKEGVTIDIDEIDEPEGIYVCTARHNDLVRGIEYNLLNPNVKPKPEVSPENLELADEGEKCDLECGDNAHCEFTEIGKECVCDHRFQGNVSEGCTLNCKSHGDCPQNTVCYSDLKCRNPCVHSIRCGTGAECRVENAYPVCVCPENFVGDPKKECFNAVQQDSPSALNSLPGKCSRKCGDNAYCTNIQGKETCKCRHGLEECDIPCDSHDDCPEEFSCNTLGKCHSPCIHNMRCGIGANCEVQNHRPVCFCPKITSGDPMKECSRKIEYQSDQPSPPSSSDNETSTAITLEASKDKCFSTEECEPNEMCLELGVESGKQCIDPCLTKRCGKNAICRTVNHSASCFCRDGFSGNADRKCRRIRKQSFGVPKALRMRPEEVRSLDLRAKLDQDCQIDQDCGTSLRCQTAATYRKCVDPCDRMECRSGLECSVTNHRATCVCPQGYTGNSRIGCTKDIDLNETSISTQNLCGFLRCGPHSECRMDSNGQPTCACRSYARGEPPSCYQECNSSQDCELGLACIQKQCRKSVESELKIAHLNESEAWQKLFMQGIQEQYYV